MFTILEPVTGQEALDGAEKFTDWEQFQRTLGIVSLFCYRNTIKKTKILNFTCCYNTWL
jgi:hypothetical protein